MDDNKVILAREVPPNYKKEQRFTQSHAFSHPIVVVGRLVVVMLLVFIT